MMAIKINAAVEAAQTPGRGMASKNPRLDDLNIDFDAIRKYTVDPRTGVITTNGTLLDHQLAMDAIERIGLIPGGWPKTPQPGAAELPPAETPSAQPATLPSTPSKTIAEVAASWLAERAQKNGARTVYAKQVHYAELIRFMARGVDMEGFGKAKLAVFKKAKQDAAREAAKIAGKAFRQIEDVNLEAMFLAERARLDALDKAKIVEFKTFLLASGQKAKTVDNKLLTISDFLQYAIGNGLLTSNGVSPVKGTFILSKAQRTAKAERFNEFTDSDIVKMFEPAAYKARMNEPDLYWCPLIALFSGMRISEATGIYCDDVMTTPAGVDYIHVRKSKTNAGVRNVPIAQSLLDLGFLSFVAQQRADGHDRLFPDRLLINESYSKELSQAFREHLLAVGVRKKADKSERKSFHSFRVGAVTHLANKGANTVQSMKIVGHDSGAQGIETHMGYVRDLPDLKAVVDRMRWPIDLARLQLP